MKSISIVSVAALCAALLAGTAQAEAKSSTTKKLLIGAGVGVAAGAAGAILINKMQSKGASASDTTGSIRSARAARPAVDEDDDDEEPVQRRPVKRGVDKTTTGSITKASHQESCTVRSVDLFDRKGNYVKAERMRVCN